MKSNYFVEIYKTTTIDLKTNVKDTIDRLEKLNGACRVIGDNGLPMRFYCNKKGKFYTVPSNSKQVYNVPAMYFLNIIYIKGNVEQNGNKTRVNIHRVYNRLAFLLPIFAIIFMLFCACLTIWSNCVYPSENGILTELLIFAGCIIFTIIYTCAIASSSDHPRLEELENQVIARIKAVERWND